MNKPVAFMMVAGELSGDLLGAGLIDALRKFYPEATFFGVGGPRMIEAGLTSLAPMDTLSIMGLFEVIRHFPSLYRLKNDLVREGIQRQPVAFIGIDAPDFNLRLAFALKKQGMLTFHYVSPSIWVWREKRVFTIKKAIDRVLCLFPFEPALYHQYNIDAVCVGHCLGDEIPLEPDVRQARLELLLNQDFQYLAILPGSRVSEVSRLLPVFLETALILLQKNNQVRFLIPSATPKIRAMIQMQLASFDAQTMAHFIVTNGQSRTVMTAADAVLLASGTASLEAMLLKKPMVVAYKFNAFTAWLARKIVKTKFFSLPNILANKALVPELFQEEVSVERLVPLLEESLTMIGQEKIRAPFYALHHELRLHADQAAAKAIYDKISSI